MTSRPVRPALFSVTALLTVLSCCAGNAGAQDLIEFLSGARAQGKITEIRKDAREFDFQLQLGQRTLKQTYPFSKVHAVTYNGKRYVLTERSSLAAIAEETATPSERSRSEIKRLINTVGGSPPDWFKSTSLDYPDSLDLAWPLKAEGKWNNQRNVGQYLWDIINPNEDRWRSGIRLIHHLMTLHKADASLLNRDMKTLASMYFRLFQDYPRAAFWFEKARIRKGQVDSVLLAECYWRMGNEAMASEQLQAQTQSLQSIKLLGDMGQTERALRLADLYGRSSRQPHEAYLLAGDACRLAGRYDQAISYYEKVLSAGDARNAEYDARYKGRAQESIDAIQLFDRANVSQVQDGQYRASSIGYNGQMEVEVTVRDRRIDSVTITKHREKQFYAALTDTTAQIISKQSVTEIDATSRATITSQAIVNATAKALAQGSE